MFVVGLTGGIASGKTTVARILEELGAVVIDADLISKELVKPGMPAWQEIISSFGRGIINEDQSINRKKLGEIIFNDAKKRKKINAILHSRVIREEWKRVKEIQKYNPDALIVLNVALLIESGNYKAVDMVVVVTADRERMIGRMMQRDGVSRDEAVMRLNSQMPLDEKEKYAHYIVNNNGSLNDLRMNVMELYAEICIKKSSTDHFDN